MKILISGLLVLASVTAASAQYRTYQSPYGGYGTGSNPNSHYVSPYTRNDGTFVQPHYQTNPDSTRRD